MLPRPAFFHLGMVGRANFGGPEAYFLNQKLQGPLGCHNITPCPHHSLAQGAELYLNTCSQAEFRKGLIQFKNQFKGPSGPAGHQVYVILRWKKSKDVDHPTTLSTGRSTGGPHEPQSSNIPNMPLNWMWTMMDTTAAAEDVILLE